MNRGRITSIIAAAGVAAAAGLTLAGAASNPASASAPAAPAAPAAAPARAAGAEHTVVVLDCLSKPQVKPRDFVLACADGNSALSKLAWTSWTPAMASAAGTLVQNDCVPSCAGGHFRGYPVLAVLWGPVSFRHGQRFGEITLIFPGARPPVFNGRQWVPGPQTVSSQLH